MKSVFAFAWSASVASVAALVMVTPACSSTTTPPAPAVCDDAKCAPGNKCLALDGDTKCRKTCASNGDPTSSCPAGFACASTNAPSTIPPECTKAPAESAALCAPINTHSGSKLAAFSCPAATRAKSKCLASADENIQCCNEAPAETFVQPFCVKSYRDLGAGANGFGALCDPSKGLENPGCDASKGLSCHGTSPADATAYCSYYNCSSDRECGPTYYCGAVNVSPNVTTPKVSLRETTTVCLRRNYCAPCNADFDCPQLDGRTQRCVLDDNSVGFCSPECAENANCPFDARCVDAGIGTKTCYPRAGTCVGDGTLCSPCRSDADCGDDGACVKGEYTTERFCAKKALATCSPSVKASCPASSKTPAPRVGCTSVPDDPKLVNPNPEVPYNYCVGVYTFGEAGDLGCWTPNR